MNDKQQEVFVYFITESRKLPIRGFSKLNPNFSVSEKLPEKEKKAMCFQLLELVSID
jgi:hypothetical protein